MGRRLGERLRFLGPSNVVFVTWPNSNALKIEAYCQQRQARELVSRFGGRVTQASGAHLDRRPCTSTRSVVDPRKAQSLFRSARSGGTWKQSGSKVRRHLHSRRDGIWHRRACHDGDLLAASRRHCRRLFPPTSLLLTSAQAQEFWRSPPRLSEPAESRLWTLIVSPSALPSKTPPPMDSRR